MSIIFCFLLGPGGRVSHHRAPLGQEGIHGARFPEPRAGLLKQVAGVWFMSRGDRCPPKKNGFDPLKIIIHVRTKPTGTRMKPQKPATGARWVYVHRNVTGAGGRNPTWISATMEPLSHRDERLDKTAAFFSNVDVLPPGPPPVGYRHVAIEAERAPTAGTFPGRGPGFGRSHPPSKHHQEDFIAPLSIYLDPIYSIMTYPTSYTAGRPPLEGDKNTANHPQIRGVPTAGPNGSGDPHEKPGLT